MLLGRWSPHPIIAVLFWYKAILYIPSPVLLQKAKNLNRYSCSVEELFEHCSMRSLYILHPFRSAFSSLPHLSLFHIGDWQLHGTVWANAPSSWTLRRDCVTLFSHFSPTLQLMQLPREEVSQPQATRVQWLKATLRSQGCSYTESLCYRKLQWCFGHSFSIWKLFRQNLLSLNMEHWQVSSQLLHNWNHEHVYYITKLTIIDSVYLNFVSLAMFPIQQNLKLICSVTWTGFKIFSSQSSALLLFGSFKN